MSEATTDTVLTPPDPNDPKNQLPPPPDEIPIPDEGTGKEAVEVSENKAGDGELRKADPPDIELKLSIHLHTTFTEEESVEITHEMNRRLRNAEAQTLRRLEALEATGLCNLGKLKLYKEGLVEIPTRADGYDDRDRSQKTSHEMRCAIVNFRRIVDKVVRNTVYVRENTEKKMNFIKGVPFATVVVENDDEENSMWITDKAMREYEEICKMVLEAWEKYSQQKRAEDPDCFVKPLNCFDLIFRRRPLQFYRLNRFNEKWEFENEGTSVETIDYKLYWPESLTDLKEKVIELHKKREERARPLDPEYRYTSFVLNVKLTGESLNSNAAESGIREFFKTVKTQFDLRAVESGAVFNLNLPSAYFIDEDAFKNMFETAITIMPGVNIQFVLHGPNGVTFINSQDLVEYRTSKGISIHPIQPRNVT